RCESAGRDRPSAHCNIARGCARAASGHAAAAPPNSVMNSRRFRSPRPQLPSSMLGLPLRRKNDAEQYPFVRAYLPGSADMSATIRRDNIVDLVIGNRRPFAVHLDVVMVADHATLRRATVHEVTARASAIVSLQR